MTQFLKGQELRKKVVFSLDSPNSTVEWPSISSANQDIILDLLCSLLAPVGQHRNLYIQPSKGKRSRKRKRAPLSDISATPAPAQSIPPPPPPPPPPPSPPPLELASSLTIGLNSTTRYLESMATQTPLTQATSKPRLLAVFVCRSDSQPSQLHSHLPLLCNVASRSSLGRPVKLIQLPRGAEVRLTTSLAIPQAGFLGLMEGALESSSLLRFLDEKVPAVKVLWLEGSLGYQTTVIKAMKTTAPPPKKNPKGHPTKTVVRVGSRENVV